ncbi:MAG: transcription elongation factor GreA [Chloroflexi bacterium]|nr:transcription elongation factor GreA [Chloroflexota bacterium]
MNTENDSAVYITAEGLQKLKEEVEWREKVRRPEIAKQIEAARKEGDLSENAGYDEAKYQAGMNEGRVQDLQAKIKHAVIFEANDGPTDTVELGRTVTIKDVEYGDEEVYTIVGAAEADPGNGMISYKSPIGGALVGKQIGAKVQVDTPGGQLEFDIISIK